MKVHIDDIEMMTQILSNLHKAYNNTVENIEDEFDDENDTLNIKSIHGDLSEKYDWMNIRPENNNSQEYKKSFFLKSQYKVTFTTWEKYGQKRN